MVMVKSKFIWRYALAVLCLVSVFFTACDAEIEDKPDPTGATPSVTATKAVGPINQLIFNDTHNVAEEISLNVSLAILEEIDRFERFNDNAFQALVSTGLIEANEYEDEEAILTMEELVFELTKPGASPSNLPGTDCTEEGVCNCAIEGTRTYSGSLTVTVEANSRAGSIVGTYFITYDNCLDFVDLALDDGTCNMTIKTTGTIQQDINFTFSDFSNIDPNEVDTISQLSSRDINQTSVTQASLNFSNGDAFGTVFAEADTVDFDFALDYTDSTADVEPLGSLVHDGTEYNMVVMQDFMESLSNIEVCQ